MEPSATLDVFHNSTLELGVGELKRKAGNAPELNHAWFTYIYIASA